MIDTPCRPAARSCLVVPALPGGPTNVRSLCTRETRQLATFQILSLGAQFSPFLLSFIDRECELGAKLQSACHAAPRRRLSRGLVQLSRPVHGPTLATLRASLLGHALEQLVVTAAWQGLHQIATRVHTLASSVACKPVDLTKCVVTLDGQLHFYDLGWCPATRADTRRLAASRYVDVPYAELAYAVVTAEQTTNELNDLAAAWGVGGRAATRVELAAYARSLHSAASAAEAEDEDEQTVAGDPLDFSAWPT